MGQTLINSEDILVYNLTDPNIFLEIFSTQKQAKDDLLAVTGEWALSAFTDRAVLSEEEEEERAESVHLATKYQYQYQLPVGLNMEVCWPALVLIRRSL